MNCPACGQRTIGFLRWFVSFNSWFWTCPHCGARLRFNRSSTAWKVVQGLVLVPWAVLYVMNIKALLMDKPIDDVRRLVLPISLIWGAIAFAVATVLNYVAYRSGSYVVRETDNKPAMPRWRRWLWMAAGIVVASIVVILAIGTYLAKPIINAIACYNMGAAEYKNADYDRAVGDFSKAIQLYPMFAGAYNYRALCQIRRAEYDKALADLNAVLRIEPNHASAHTNRGYVYYAQGDSDKAIADLSQAIELGPQVAFRWAYRAHAYEQKGEHDKAVTDFTEAIRLKPETWQYYADRGNAYFYKGDFTKAFVDFDKAQRMERKSEEAEDEKE